MASSEASSVGSSKDISRRVQSYGSVRSGTIDTVREGMKHCENLTLRGLRHNDCHYTKKR
jgi:hypothetical protein